MVLDESSCPRCGGALVPRGDEAPSCPRCGPSGPEPSVIGQQVGVKVSRRGRTALIAGLAVVAIGIAAAVTYYPIVRGRRSETRRGQQPPGRRPAGRRPKLGACRTREIPRSAASCGCSGTRRAAKRS